MIHSLISYKDANKYNIQNDKNIFFVWKCSVSYDVIQAVWSIKVNDPKCSEAIGQIFFPVAEYIATISEFSGAYSSVPFQLIIIA